MPIHDWTRVDAGLFHHFHQEWAISLCHALNAESLPAAKQPDDPGPPHLTSPALLSVPGLV